MAMFVKWGGNDEISPPESAPLKPPKFPNLIDVPSSLTLAKATRRNGPLKTPMAAI